MGEPPVIRIASRSSRISIKATLGSAVRAERGHVLQQPDGSFDVSDREGSSIVLHCPPRSSITISTASGSVSIEGELASVHIVTASGRVDIEQAAELEIRTASGRVDIGQCQHNCRVTTQTGRIDVGASGGVELSSTTGRVAVRQADRAVVRTVSGQIELGVTASATVQAHSISGKVAVHVEGEAPARMQLASKSGRIVRRVPDGEGGADIEVTTTSGSIAIERR